LLVKQLLTFNQSSSSIAVFKSGSSFEIAREGACFQISATASNDAVGSHGSTVDNSVVNPLESAADIRGWKLLVPSPPTFEGRDFELNRSATPLPTALGRSVNLTYKSKIPTMSIALTTKIVAKSRSSRRVIGVPRVSINRLLRYEIPPTAAVDAQRTLPADATAAEPISAHQSPVPRRRAWGNEPGCDGLKFQRIARAKAYLVKVGTSNAPRTLCDVATGSFWLEATTNS
jgi:hypothetical protein